MGRGNLRARAVLTNGDKVVVYLHVWVRLKDSIDWVGGRFADGFVFRNGQITQYLSFGERLDARTWAGIEEHDLPHAGELSLLLDADGMPGVEM